MFALRISVVLLLGFVGAARGLSCFCGSQPCQTPVCCDSGHYTPDECGCCLTCAKAEDERCGGPFQSSGTCSTGNRCLRKCECKTVKDNNCVFPFTFEGVTFKSCTNVTSENGASWCATEVDGKGVVVTNKWEDCRDGCPGTNFQCDESFLFNVDGSCVNGSDAPAMLAKIRAGPLVALLDEDTSQVQKPAPSCLGRSVSSCRCSTEPLLTGLDGHPKGGCVKPVGDVIQESMENGWCFVTNIQDPADPKKNCFEDTEWSVADGRFWSSLACKEEAKIKDQFLTDDAVAAA